MKTLTRAFTLFSALILFHAAPVPRAVLASDPATPAGEVPTRDQIDDKYKWDLSAMFADDAAWEAEFKKLDDDIARFRAAHRGKLGASAESLLAALDAASQLSIRQGNVFAYANQQLHTDGANTRFQEMATRATGLSARLAEATSWMQPEMLTIPADTIASWCESSAKLRVYRHYLDNVLREKPHTLDEQGERLLALTGQMAAAPEQAYASFKDVELPFPKIKDEQGNEVTLSETRYYAFRTSADRRLRKDSFLGTMSAYKPFQTTFANLLAGAIHGDVFRARARGFNTSLEAALFADNIPVAVYDNLIRTINANIALSHRYTELRKRLYKVDELHVYDMYSPLVPDTGRTYTYEDAVHLTLEGLQPLGPDYLGPMTKGFESRWVDVFETRGKRGGAYSWGSYLSKTPYLLLNFNGTFHDVSTVAHEMGHSMHSYFTFTNQPPVYGDYATFVAEVASTCNEILLQEYLLARADSRDEKLFLLDQFLDSIRQTVFRQTMFAEFELALHEAAERGDALTGDMMGKLGIELYGKYHGPALVVDPEMDVYFLRIPHFFSGFYVYQYATSYSAAATLAKGILEKHPGALDAYLGFLRSGSSDYPIEVLKKAGVDMTKPQPIEDCMARFKSLLDRFEQTYNEKS